MRARSVVTLGLALASGIGAVVTAIASPSAWAVAWLVAAACVLAGLGLGMLLADLGPDELAREPRKVEGPDAPTRRILLRVGLLGLAGTVTAILLGGAGPAQQATRRRLHTAWADGERLVDDRGRLVVAADLGDGEMATVYPESAPGDPDSQAVLLRVAPERLRPDVRQGPAAAAGFVAYSKLCTHMACPLGLFEQRSGRLVCPCHQASFDALDGGRAVRGPARRALPALPIAVDDDDHLIAGGDFDDAVGTGFWGRP